MKRPPISPIVADLLLFLSAGVPVAEAFRAPAALDVLAEVCAAVYGADPMALVR